MKATIRETGTRAWAVQSSTQSHKERFPVFHLVTWDAGAAAWICPCPSRKPCVHSRFAGMASKMERDIKQKQMKIEQERLEREQEIDRALFEAEHASDVYDAFDEPMIARNDTGAHLWRTTTGRVQEAW